MRTVALEDELETAIGRPISRGRDRSPDTGDESDPHGDRAALQAAMEKLPAPLLEVILLCDVEEMKYREIAVILESRSARSCRVSPAHAQHCVKRCRLNLFT